MADYGYIASPNVPDPMKSLASIANTANAMQQFQANNLELQKAQQMQKDRLALQDYMQNNPQRWKNEDGSLNIENMTADVPRIAPLAGPDFVAKMTMLGNAQTQANDAKLQFTKQERSVIGGVYGALASAGVKDPATVAGALDDLKTQFPDNPNMHRYIDAAKVSLANVPPGEGLPKQLRTQSLAVLSPQEQISATQPHYTDTGTALVQTSPYGTGPQAIKKQIAEAGTTAGNVQAINEDWKNTQEATQTAQQDIGVLNNIKRLSKTAFTGIGADRQAMLAGIAGKLGMTVEQLQKTDTDLLAKNSNMLALAGGNTDAARAMAESANSNTHMTPEAIAHAADQVIGQKRKALAKQQYLMPYYNEVQKTGNTAAYNNALAEFNQHADPRIMQYETMNPQERQQFAAGMGAEEKKAFRTHLMWALAHGVIKDQ